MAARLRPVYACLLISAAMVLWANNRLSHALEWRYTPANELIVTENYLTDIGALMLGSHRLAADIAYIQFLQYYGMEESQEPRVIDRAGHRDETAGFYPRLKEFATRTLRLDPFFNKPVLEAAGALAFNQKRVDESLALLKEAIQRDPWYFRYHLYASAILFKEKGNDADLINILLKAAKQPDCPAMFELVLGNLLKKVGRFEEAAQTYVHVYETAPQENDRHDAVGRLYALLMERPELRGEFQVPASAAR